MAIITTEEMNYLATLLGDAYQNGLTGYGDTDTPGTVSYEISKAKVYVRGGTEARNGIRADSLNSQQNALDLEPSVSTTTVNIRRGKFYIDSNINELYTDRSFSFAFDEDFWMSAGLTEATWDELLTDLAANTAKVVTQHRAKALVYASDEPISDATAGEMDSYINFSTTHADLRINATTDWFAAEFKPTANTQSRYLDKVKLYISSVGSPNTGLICDVYADDSGSPDVSGGVILSSFQVDNIDADGSWVDFVFVDPTVLTGGSVYWLVLKPGTPTGSVAANLAGGIYYRWHFKSAAYANGANDDILPSTDGGSTWGSDIGATGGGGSGIQPAMQFITYLKVIYSGIMADFDSTETGNPSNTLSNIVDTIVTPIPSVNDYAAICSATLVSSNGTFSAGTIPITSTVTITDERQVVAYEGLEDDDKMSVIFPGLDTTENEIQKVSNALTTSPLASSFSATVSALNTHISTLSSGNTFKSYWRLQENYFDRSFRQLWWVNSREELTIDFGTFTATGSNSVEYTNGSDGWASTDSWAADMTTGVSLEIYNPVVTGAAILLKIFGITTTYTELTANAVATDSSISVEDPSLFIVGDYIWVEKWNGSTFNGDLLKVLTVTGNVIAVGSGEAGVCNGYVTYTHSIGDRVYLVDDVEVTIASGTAAQTRTTITPTVTGTKFLGVAYLQPTYSGAKYGTASNQYVARSV